MNQNILQERKVTCYYKCKKPTKFNEFKYALIFKNQFKILVLILNIYNRYFGVTGGFWFSSIHMLHMYFKIHGEELSETGSSTEQHTNLRAFATSMIEAGEILLTLCISFLGNVNCLRYKVFIYLFNQLIDYNKKLSGNLAKVLRNLLQYIKYVYIIYIKI